MPRVTFLHPEGKSGEVPEGLSLLEVADRAHRTEHVITLVRVLAGDQQVVPGPKCSGDGFDDLVFGSWQPGLVVVEFFAEGVISEAEEMKGLLSHRFLSLSVVLPSMSSRATSAGRKWMVGSVTARFFGALRRRRAFFAGSARWRLWRRPSKTRWGSSAAR